MTIISRTTHFVPPKVLPKISKLVDISVICQCKNPYKYDIVNSFNSSK